MREGHSNIIFVIILISFVTTIFVERVVDSDFSRFDRKNMKIVGIEPTTSEKKNMTFPL